MNPTLAELMPHLAIQLQKEIQNGHLSLRMTSRGLTISFSQAALFPSGTDEIAPELNATIKIIANAMNQVHNPARAEGHTDSIPIHNAKFRSNWELSAARSIALTELLIQDAWDASDFPSPGTPTQIPSTPTIPRPDVKRTGAWTS